MTIRFNARERLNAVTTDMLRTAAGAVESAARDRSVRVVVVTGTGRAFCSGADLSGPSNEDSSFPDMSLVDAANRLTVALVGLSKPVVCALNGVAAGLGVSIALGCDIVVACEDAYFLLAFTKVGLMPDGGATLLVAASLGRARALQLALLAERLSMAEALASGLVWSVHDRDSFADAVESLTARLARGATAALGRTKRAINDASIPGLATVLRAEREGQSDLLVGPEYVEGVDAFVNRRDPRFGC
ncbi:enoyl-CoA hydratase/isomerase family protein [Rhodococcus fascians]|nr:enoyl-CoA hydratase/isomerase family protein [Rhodococcus fascians]MBY4114692.1 enoyl-CoA hydratase/isomerase family protein [Rhodococcus fascians]